MKKNGMQRTKRNIKVIDKTPNDAKLKIIETKRT